MLYNLYLISTFFLHHNNINPVNSFGSIDVWNSSNRRARPVYTYIYVRHRLLKLRTVNSHARVPELGLQI